jgi:hypothetical protein
VRDGNQREIPRQAEDDHKDGCDKEAHQHNGTSSQAIGQFPAAQLRDERPGAEEGNHQCSLADGNGALLREIKRQEGDHEAAETIDERAGPDQPIRGRQSLHEGSETFFVHFPFPWVSESNQRTKNRRASQGGSYVTLECVLRLSARNEVTRQTPIRPSA